MQTVTVQRSPFDHLADGTPVEAFTMELPGVARVRVSAYAGAVLSIHVPDRDGRMGDVVLGFDTLDEYLADESFQGALIGRSGNRIARGRFTLDGHEHQLLINNAPNHLHGGPRGFHKRLWAAETVETSEGAGVRLRLTSDDGDQGYPGTVDVTVTYLLTSEGALRVEYDAVTDTPTPVNLTQHTYWNLTADPRREILGHRLRLNADAITPVDETLIPTGELAAVEGTPFDFRDEQPIGARADADDEQLRYAGGYDHNFALRGAGTLALAARVHEPESGRVLEVHTTQPGIQFYSGNFLDGTTVGKGGIAYAHRTGLCLEPQAYPDAPNHPHFSSTILRPGERYSSLILYRFGAE
ncbi:galactose-1-epimerase [Longimicrobium terrae]|uniref:Aldose 1-epimerase n=1 Tax=Longimicrobium terrae TaxID=1639882 RepID=A0A841GU13_9BACT|nr:aldose 1-epimerase [Longimicrobium terrae]MBB6070169.1 aldose 1-epimerase [Longimicrobium terrae]NNC33070.1 galactose mutarotase [Longimicrobium terrae]